MKYNYLIQVLIGLDQLVNTLFGGWADETISARAFRCREKSLRWYYFEKFINALFIFEDLWWWSKVGHFPTIRHCQRSFNAERDREQLPIEYRK